MVTTRSRGTNANKAAPPTKKAQKAKAKKPAAAPKKEEVSTKKEETTPSEQVAEIVTSKTVIIEAARAEAAFKTRANKIVKGVGDRAKVVVNAEKPAKGNFVVRVEGVEKPIVELIGMARPFPALKSLDMDEVVQNVLGAL
eukprot:CAMPEP_0196807824 /NCGR_PEP_ID=MMETSP1362-20130617/7817_1 /TAXON_ID=163516 /ORGANISM="Leptocylindrus danicus, Strain CCMP1856" /LENGTH=140 /DNA_ID=CAMNT_0042181905 /DNA_START=37 /DNA_END=459 /DNA_ORIENTATION=+